MVRRAAVVLVGAGSVVLVGRDGTLGWQLVRVVVVLMLALALWQADGLLAPSRRAVVDLVAAIVVVPVGVGVAGPHLAKVPGSVLAVAGAAILVGGLALGGLGSGQLVRALARGPALSIVAGSVVILAVACWTLGQAVAATNVPRPAVGEETPSELGLAYADVEFAATDGVLLSGWWLAPSNGAAVVAVHGAGSTRSNVLGHAAVLASHGYGVLLFDERGHGRSAGRAMDFGWFGDEDIGGAVAFVGRQPGVDPARIAVLGLSMGGEQAIGAAASIDAISAVVAEGATGRVAADQAWLSDVYGFRGALTEGVARLTYGFTDVLTSASPPIDLRRAARDAAPVPMLLIAAGDVEDEPHAARHVAGGSPETVEVWVAPDTGHTDALRSHPAEWERRVIAFLDEALATGRP